LNTAKDNNDQATKRILNLAKQLNIATKNIQTNYIDIRPRYEGYDDDREFIGYFVSKTIVVTLKDLSLLEGFLAGALDAGANHVHGVEFRSTELKKHREQARLLAIRAAKEKAKNVAGELGQEIGVPYAIQEGGLSNSAGWGRGMSQNVVQSAVQTVISEGGGTIAPGQITVSASVSVSFELK